MKYIELLPAIGRLGMLVVVMIAGSYWVFHHQYELALLCAIVLSLIGIERQLEISASNNKGDGT